MPTLSNIVGQEISRQLCRYIPNSQPVFDVLSTVIGTGFDSFFRASRVPQNQQLQFFQSLVREDASSPSPDSESTGSNDDALSTTGARVANVLAPALAGPLWNSPLPSATPASPPRPRSVASGDIQALFAALAQDPIFSGVGNALQDSGVLQLAAIPTVLGAVSTSGRYSPERVQETLRLIARALARYFPVGVAAVQYVEREIALSTLRSALALAISEAVENLPFNLGSSREIGNYVHGYLQEGYVHLLSSTRDVAVEQFNQRARRSELYVIGPTTGGSQISLQDLALDRRRDHDYFFASLRAAMNGFHIYNENSWLRADLVDCSSHEIWEIKPIANLFGGVWQEAFYRVTHNLVRMVVGVVMPRAVSRPRFLAGGGFWPVTEMTSAGFAVLEPIRVSSQARRPALAIPFQIGLLPGLIGYFVLRGPNIGDLEVVIETIIITGLGEALRRMLRMLNELERLWGRAVQVARQIIQRLLPVLRNIAEIVYRILTVFAILAAAGALGLIISLLPEAVAGAALVIVIVAAVSAGQSADDTGRDQQAPPPGTTAVKIGNISVTGVPVDRVPEFLAAVETQFVEIAGEFARTMQGGGRSSVPVAPSG